MVPDPVCRVAVLCLHTSPAAAPGRGASGGLNVYVRELTRALQAEGVESDVLVRSGARGASLPQPLDGGGTLIPVPVGPDRDLTPGEERDLVDHLSSATTAVVSASGRYDLVASHHWMSGRVGQHVASRLGKPLVHTAHTWAVQKNGRLAPGAEPEPGWREHLEALVARGADQILVATAGEREMLAAHYGAGDRCSIVVPGVDVDTFRPGDGRRSDPPFFLVAGRLERLKGVDTALAALAALRHPSARLVVVGDDGGKQGERDRLRRVAHDLGIAARVDFVGSLDRGSLAWLLGRATACLFPSYAETFGLVALEALACGAPLVTTRAAGVATVVEDGVSALLVERDGFQVAMQRLLDNPSLVRRLGAEGRAVALNRTWRHSAREWLQAVGVGGVLEPALGR